jgi:hypothetical protein
MSPAGEKINMEYSMKIFKIVLVGLTIFSSISSRGDSTQIIINALQFISPGTYQTNPDVPGCAHFLTVEVLNSNISLSAPPQFSGFDTTDLNWVETSATSISAQRVYDKNQTEITDEKTTGLPPQYKSFYELIINKNSVSITQKNKYPEINIEPETNIYELQIDQVKIQTPRYLKGGSTTIHVDCIYKKNNSQSKKNTTKPQSEIQSPAQKTVTTAPTKAAPPVVQ